MSQLLDWFPMFTAFALGMVAGVGFALFCIRAINKEDAEQATRLESE